MPAKFQKCFAQAILYWEFEDQRANSVDPDEVAHNEPPHLDLRCLQIQLHVQCIFVFGTSSIIRDADQTEQIHLLCKEQPDPQFVYPLSCLPCQPLGRHRCQHIQGLRVLFGLSMCKTLAVQTNPQLDEVRFCLTPAVIWKFQLFCYSTWETRNIIFYFF